MSRRPLTEQDFTLAEQECLRNALYYCRAKFGSWKRLAQVMRYEEQTVSQIGSGHRNVAPALVIRMSKILKVPVEDLTSGRFPPSGTCPRCAYCATIDGPVAPQKAIVS